MMIPEAAQALVLAAETYGPFNLCVAYSMGAAIALVGVSKGLHVAKLAFLAPPANYVHQLTLSARAAGSRDKLNAAALWRFPKPDVKGRTEVLLTPLELLDALGKFAPPPRVHRH